MPAERLLRFSSLLTSLLFLLLSSWLGSDSRAEEEPQRILMLHAYNYTFPATTIIADAARKRIAERSRKKIEIDADFLDLARATNSEHEVITAAFLAKKYARTRHDVIITLGSAALPFLMKHRSTIAPTVPVVFTTISPQTYAALRGPADVTGIVTNFNLDKTIELAEWLQPNASRLIVVAGSGEADRRWQSVARTAIEGRGRKFEVDYLFDMSYARVFEELRKAPRDAIVIILTMFADSEGRTFVPADLAAELSAISPAPVYTPYATHVGRGIVGGFVETFESIGLSAADLVMDILEGKGATPPPPRENRGQAFRVDYRAMQRWNLSERNLPPDAVMLFKPPTIWEQHREAAIAIAAAFLLQSFLVTVLLIQRYRKQKAEDQLKDSEERMTFAATSANIGLWQFDRKTGELWASEHCRAIFGIPRDRKLTRDEFLAVIHTEDIEAARSSMQTAVEAQRPASSDVRVLLPNKHFRWVRMRARSFLDDPQKVGGIFIDITDQKAAEAEASEQRHEVAHLMRVSVLGELSGAIAHEINQPLTAILSHAQAALHLLSHKTPEVEEVREALADIVQEDKRAGEVIQRLRVLLKKGDSKSRCVDLGELVRSTLALLRTELIRRQTVVDFNCPDGVPDIWGDPVQLQQVLLNLIMNAMDAMEDTPREQRRIVIAISAAGNDGVELSVRDHGPGIDPRSESQLFKPFHTSKEHGLGLGLAICQTIIQAHGGRLTLTNHKGKGAVAAFSLVANESAVAAE